MCYIRNEDMIHIPNEIKSELPILQTNSETIFDDLKYIIDNRYKLANTAKKSREYIEKWHDILKYRLK